MIKRIAAVISCISLLILFIIPAFSGFVYSTDELTAVQSVPMKWYSKNDWSIVSGADSIHLRKTGSSHLIYVTSGEPDGAMVIAYEPENAIDFSDYNELGFKLTLSNANEAIYEITYYYQGGNFSDSVRGKTGAGNTVFFALPAESSNKITRIELSIDSNTKLNYFAIEDIFADNYYTYSYAERFESRRITVLDGNAVLKEDHIELVTDENGAHIECSLVKDYKGITAMVIADISSPHSGILTLKNDGSGASQTAALYSGNAKYSFIVSDVGSVLELGVYEGDISMDAPIIFNSLEIITVTDEEPATYGSIESCVYEDNVVTLKGTVTTEATVDYIKSDIVVYKVPYNYNGEELTEEPEAKMNISTAFEISVPAEYDHTQWKYLVAIKTKDKTIPLASPVFAVSKATLSGALQECFVGIHNVNPTTAFESEADSIVLDVDINRLFTSADTSAAHRYAYKDIVYFIDSNYIGELDSAIGFHNTSGRKIYLNIVAQGADFAGFCSDDEQSVHFLCAAGAYIGDKFQDVAGIVMFGEIDYTGELMTKAYDASLLLGMFSASFRAVNQTAKIYLSFDSENLFAAPLVAYYNGFNGINNIGIFYESDDSVNSIPKVKAAMDASAAGALYRESLILWRCDDAFGMSQMFAQLHDNAVNSGISGVILSPAESIGEDSVYECFSDILGSGLLRYEFTASSANDRYRGAYSLWDFSNSYDTFGWFAGGNCSSPETVKSLYVDGRAMQTIIDPSKGEEGILVCWFEDETDLSIADALKMDFYIDVNTGEAMEVTIVLGGDGVKAEYRSQIYYGNNTLYADVGLLPEANKLEYMAVIVDIDKDAVLEVLDISAVSKQLGDDELKNEMHPRPADSSDMASLYIFFGAIISASILVFAILSKKTGIKHNNSN